MPWVDNFPAPDQPHPSYTHLCKVQKLLEGTSKGLPECIQVILFLGILFMTPNKSNLPLKDVCCDFRKQCPKAEGKHELNWAREKYVYTHMYLHTHTHMYSVNICMYMYKESFKGGLQRPKPYGFIIKRSEQFWPNRHF